ncbi:MAG: response regulator transcription factor, partial [Alphaproteobacteria bacterium]|nr:response regulator transcription factor [Alphaproteobacteria bacterium]
MTENIAAPPVLRPESPPPADDRRIKVILVDDEDQFRALAAGELEYLGFEVETYSSGEALFEARGHNLGADVVVLDWKLHSELGPELLVQMRKLGIVEPVVFFTGLPTTTYESAALDCGAVDFVDKARGMPILAKRLRRIVEWQKQHTSSQARPFIRLGKLTLRSEVAGAYWDLNNVGLTLTEFNVVHLLASRAGEYVDYRSI